MNQVNQVECNLTSLKVEHNYEQRFFDSKLIKMYRMGMFRNLTHLYIDVNNLFAINSNPLLSTTCDVLLKTGWLARVMDHKTSISHIQCPKLQYISITENIDRLNHFETLMDELKCLNGINIQNSIHEIKFSVIFDQFYGRHYARAQHSAYGRYGNNSNVTNARGKRINIDGNCNDDESGYSANLDEIVVDIHTGICSQVETQQQTAKVCEWLQRCEDIIINQRDLIGRRKVTKQIVFRCKQ